MSTACGLREALLVVTNPLRRVRAVVVVGEAAVVLPLVLTAVERLRETLCLVGCLMMETLRLHRSRAMAAVTVGSV